MHGFRNSRSVETALECDFLEPVNLPRTDFTIERCNSFFSNVRLDIDIEYRGKRPFPEYFVL